MKDRTDPQWIEFKLPIGISVGGNFTKVVGEPPLPKEDSNWCNEEPRARWNGARCLETDFETVSPWLNTIKRGQPSGVVDWTAKTTYAGIMHCQTGKPACGLALIPVRW